MTRAGHLAAMTMLPSLPHRPMARPPSPLMKPTICLLIEPGQHHLDDLDGRLVGDAQARRELALDAEALEHGADLRAAAVHHDRVHAGLLEQDHVAREIARDLLVAHGVAAIFHHDGRLVVAQHVGQRLDEDFGLQVGVDASVMCGFR